MAKWLARLGWDVSVVTTGAFGSSAEDAGGGGGSGPGGGEAARVRVIRSFDMQTWRARMAGHDRVDSLFDSDSYTGKPHPLSKVIVPEPLALAWAPFARRVALAAHRERPFDAVLTTSPPESAHTVGAALQRKGVRWVADIRDAWTYEPLRPPFPTKAQHRLDERLERRRLGAADAVVCVSEPAAADLRSRGIADPVVIANAWDPDSDPGPEAVATVEGLLDPERVSLLYTRRFGSYGRDPGPLARRWGRFAATAPEEAAKLELAVAGPMTPDERALLEGTGAGVVKVSLLGSLRARAVARPAAPRRLSAAARAAGPLAARHSSSSSIWRPGRRSSLADGTEAGRIAADAGVSPIVRADDPGDRRGARRPRPRRSQGPDPGASGRYAYPGAAEAMSRGPARRLAAQRGSARSGDPRRRTSFSTPYSPSRERSAIGARHGRAERPGSDASGRGHVRSAANRGFLGFARLYLACRSPRSPSSTSPSALRRWGCVEDHARRGPRRGGYQRRRRLPPLPRQSGAVRGGAGPRARRLPGRLRRRARAACRGGGGMRAIVGFHFPLVHSKPRGGANCSTPVRAPRPGSTGTSSPGSERGGARTSTTAPCATSTSC